MRSCYRYGHYGGESTASAFDVLFYMQLVSTVSKRLCKDVAVLVGSWKKVCRKRQFSLIGSCLWESLSHMHDSTSTLGGHWSWVELRCNSWNLRATDHMVEVFRCYLSFTTITVHIYSLLQNHHYISMGVLPWLQRPSLFCRLRSSNGRPLDFARFCCCGTRDLGYRYYGAAD